MSGISGIMVIDANGVQVYDLKDAVIVLRKRAPEEKIGAEVKIDTEKISISAGSIEATKTESGIRSSANKKAAFFNLSNPLFYHELKEQAFNIFRENNLSFYQAETALELLAEDLKDMKIV